MFRSIEFLDLAVSSLAEKRRFQEHLIPGIKQLKSELFLKKSQFASERILQPVDRYYETLTCEERKQISSEDKKKLSPMQRDWQLRDLFHIKASLEKKLQEALVFAQNEQDRMEGEHFFYFPGMEKVIPDFEVKNGVTGQISYSVCASKGARQQMEDCNLAIKASLQITENHEIVSVFGVFDGHNGFHAAQFVQQQFVDELLLQIKDMKRRFLTRAEILWNALKITFVSLDRKFKDLTQYQDVSGTTAVVALVFENEIWTANLGDSRAMLCILDHSIIPLSEDMKPAKESMPYGILSEAQKQFYSSCTQRIFNRGGYVIKSVYSEDGSIPRIEGRLAPAGSVGDVEIKSACARPFITKVNIPNLPADIDLILCSDGVTDIATTVKIGNFYQSVPQELRYPVVLAQGIAKAAFQSSTYDNISAVVARLRSFKG